MGVHGLTTFLRENRKLSKTILLPLPQEENPVHFVVDGWSFIFELFNKSTLPWVYGGEYPDFARLITIVTRAWLSVGMKLSFVFDGPAPELKFRTLISRMTKSHIESSLLFFRTSQASRSTPRFLNESRILPPLSYPVAIHTLLELQASEQNIDIHFADEEGDPYAVELAGRLGAYVIANDSDYAILNSDGYLGFIPLDSMVWHVPVREDNIEPADDEWVQFSAKKKPSRNPNLGRGVIPPINANTSDLTLSFTVHSPDALASFLDIPITLLPLMGALVGNDFSSHSQSNVGKQVQHIFFEHRMSSSSRITRVASVLQSIISHTLIPQKKKKAKHHVGSVMDLISKTVQELFIRPVDSFGSGEVEEIIESVVNSTLQYAIHKSDSDAIDGLWPSPLCALHEPDSCPMVLAFSRNIAARAEAKEQQATESEDDLNSLPDDALDWLAKQEIEVRNVLVQTYREGKLSPNILNCISSGSLWPRLFLENPDLETTSKITRTIRQWYCAILDDAVGLPAIIEEPEPENAGDMTPTTDDSEEEDENELVDVLESDSDEEGADVLAPLKGALRRLHEPESDAETASVSESLTVSPVKSKTVAEYIRRGTRVVDEDVVVPPLSELLNGIAPMIPKSLQSATEHTPSHNNHNPLRRNTPIPFLLRPPDERLIVMFCALHSSPSSEPNISQLIVKLKSLPPYQLHTALAFRWLLRYLRDRASENPSNKDIQTSKWTRREAQCFLASFTWDPSNESTADQSQNLGYPPLFDRNVQLLIQAIQCLDSVHQLAEVMLLGDRVSSPAHLFSGRKFHSYLTGGSPLPDPDFDSDSNVIPRELWEACLYDLEDAFGEERTKKSKKKSKAEAKTGTQTSMKPSSASKNSGKGKGGLFDLLGDVEA